MCKFEMTAGVGGLGRHAGIINLSCELYLRFPALIFSSFVNLKHTHARPQAKIFDFNPKCFPSTSDNFFSELELPHPDHSPCQWIYLL